MGLGYDVILAEGSVVVNRALDEAAP